MGESKIAFSARWQEQDASDDVWCACNSLLFLARTKFPSFELIVDKSDQTVADYSVLQSLRGVKYAEQAMTNGQDNTKGKQWLFAEFDEIQI